MRYIAERISTTGEPKCGMSDMLIRYYVSDRNALRFMHIHLRSPFFRAGQYRVSRFPVGTFNTGKFVGNIYKQV